MMETNFSSTACFLLLIFCQLFRASGGLTTLDKAVAREQVLEMFLHGYNSYMTYAYPADELMPLSCTGRVRGQQPSRGDIDDTLGRFSLTLIDSLDTLAVLGLLDEFEDAVHKVVHDVTFDTDIVVSVFETNIRVLGGLLGGHVSAISLRKSHNRMAWYKDELLYMAKDLGYRLLPAFNTTTGVPYPRVNLRHGIGKDRKEKDTCTACAGSMLLEFSALSRLTGDPIFEDKAQHVMHTLWAKRQRSSNLVGTVINIHTGDWVRRDSGVGAGIDSYYEYLLKGYILLGDDGYYERFSTHYDAIMTYINKGPNFIDVHMHRPQSKSRNFMDALFAFWPGLQVLFGDIGPAIQTHEMLYQVTQRHKFLPELVFLAFQMVSLITSHATVHYQITMQAFTPEYDVYWGQHPLRPEFVESTYFLYKATNDPHYLEVGKDVMDSLQKYARVPCGFAGIKDVRTGSHEDRMDSFVLAETFKYLYLLFSEPQDLVLPIDDYLFTTEAHLLPLTLANYKMNNTATQMASHFSPSKDSSPTNSERSCPSHEFHFPSGKLYSAAVRDSLPSLQTTSCPSSNKETETSNKPTKPRLKASEFVPGNSEHMHQLGKMGIQLVTLDDGRVQLMHSASKAETPADADEGMKFMQEIIEITKTQQAENVDYHPRVVQIISPDLLRNIVLAAGPAQFGADLDGSKKQAILGSLVQANPFHGCTELVNKDQVQGRIVMAQRGNCMFIEKARILEKLGALGVIIMDNNESSSSDTSATFAMSGDGTDDVNIGVVFLFYKEGKILVDALQNNARVDVVVVDKAKSADEINILDIQLQMDERLGIAPVRANVGTPDARYYQQDDGGAAIPSGGPQSEGLQTTLPPHPRDSTSQGGLMPDEVELAEIKLSEGSITADASQDEGPDVIEEGSKQTSKPDKVFVNVDNVQDLLQYAGLEADLYLVNNHQNKLEEGREIYSKVSPQELQLRMEKILFKYMASDKGRTYQQDQQRSKDGGLESTSVGGIVAPEDMDLVLLQIQEEFMKLESIQNAFQKLNPNQDASIPDYRGAVNEGDGVPNSAIKGDEHAGSQSSIEDRTDTTRHTVGLSSRGEAGGDPAPLSRVELLQKRRDEIREELNRQHKENIASQKNSRTDKTVENKKEEL